MRTIKNRLVRKKTSIEAGYAAFNNGERETLSKLLSEDVKWHKMDKGGTIQGRECVLDYLMELRKTSEVELLGLAFDGDFAITVDFTHTPRGAKDHACADKIKLDASGLIEEVWHCAAETKMGAAQRSKPKPTRKVN